MLHKGALRGSLRSWRRVTVADSKPALQTKHFFPFVRMVRAMGGKALLADIMRLRSADNVEEAGMELVGILVERLPDAENEVMEFLALFTGTPREELEEQPLEELFETLKTLIADSNFLDFFKSAVK